MEIAADTQPARLEMGEQPFADANRAIFMECGVIAEAVEIKLQRFRLDEEQVWHVVDHKNREIRLSGHRAHERELREREARHIVGVRMGVRHAIEYGFFRRRWNLARLAKVDGLAALLFQADGLVCHLRNIVLYRLLGQHN